MHRKQNTDLIPADTELERTLRSLRKIKKAENSTMADERQDQNEVRSKQLEGLQSLIQWRIYGDQLFRMNTLQSDNLQLMPTTLN